MPSPSEQTPHVTDHRLGFRTLDAGHTTTALPVDGTLPGWLSGALLRNGPARFEVGGDSYRHWFDGLAMLHRFAFRDGAVTYASRFLDSPASRSAEQKGRISYSEFATDPCRSLFRRVATSFLPPAFGANANVNITRSGDEFLALTESALPVRFDPRTLETLGVGQPAPGQMTVAHPHRVPGSGDTVSYATRFGPVTTYRVYRTEEKTARRRVIAEIPVSRPAYMHSFAVTPRYLVLAEFPLVVLPVAIPLSGRPLIENYRWRPGRGTRFRVLDLATGDVVTSRQGPAFFAFHHVNAFEDGDQVVVDLCGYDDASIIGSLYLDRLRVPDVRLPEGGLRRYRVPLRGRGDVTRDPMPAARLELPRIDYGRRNGRGYRYVYGAGSGPGFMDRITKADVADGPVTEWSEPCCYPGEPVFVRVPGTDREDAGVLLSVVLDASAGTSFLLVLDAADLTEIARARVPAPIPFGFHGHYFPDIA